MDAQGKEIHIVRRSTIPNKVSNPQILMAEDRQIIFSMVALNKTIRQNNKQVLKNIDLAYFYGAKIGIVGLNGSGKSTLRKIIAVLDND